MFKSKLQEYCHSKKWNLPEYSTTREGLDHCPQFKATVTVNDSTFTTPNPSKSSKEAHNLVANIAYQHLTGSPSANNALQVSPTCVDAQQPKMNEPLQAATVSDVNFSSRDGICCMLQSSGCYYQVDMAHLYKNQLQIYAQKKNINLPIYISEREGPPHACRFKSKVMLEGKTYESFELFSTIKDAENAAAKAALASVSSDETEEEDPGFFKNLLQELAQKEYSCLPAYVTTRSGPSHHPIFSSTVEINEESFTGQEAKTKKLAEMNAAKVAYIAMKERKGKPNFKPDSLSYHVNDTPPKSQFVPIADLSDKHILAPDPISNRAHMDLVNCNKGAYHQDTVAEQTVGKPEVHTNFDQNNCGLKLDNSSGQNSSSAPIQSPSRSGVRQIDQPSPSSGVMSSHKKIKVYHVTPNMTFPTGATVMHRDEKWVAVSMDSIHGNV